MAIEALEELLSRYERDESVAYRLCPLCVVFGSSCNRCLWNRFVVDSSQGVLSACSQWLVVNSSGGINFHDLVHSQHKDIVELRRRRIAMIKEWLRVLREEA